MSDIIGNSVIIKKGNGGEPKWNVTNITSSLPFVAPSDGVIRLWGYASQGEVYCYTTHGNTSCGNNHSNWQNTFTFPIASGETFNITGSTRWTTSSVYFYGFSSDTSGSNGPWWNSKDTIAESSLPYTFPDDGMIFINLKTTNDVASPYSDSYLYTSCGCFSSGCSHGSWQNTLTVPVVAGDILSIGQRYNTTILRINYLH